jgi:CBS domain-containing protein
MSIGAYCRRNPVTTSKRASVREAAQQMAKEEVGCLFVVEREHPIGVLTDRDIALRVLPRALDPDATVVGDLMQSPVVTIPEDAPVAQAGRVMRANALRRLAVVDRKGKLVGVVAADDVLGLVGRELADLAAAVAVQAPSAPEPAAD